MRSKSMLLILCMVSILVLGIGTASASAAELSFYPDKVYVDSTTLAVEGNFYNQGVFISHLPKVDVEVQLVNAASKMVIKESYSTIGLGLGLEGTLNKTFYIHNVPKVDFSSWKEKNHF
ncbi:hypothetical protein [Sporomusa sp.]|uniref:hypothetical protein n=1 Tax=Sporomusa sp. TaxID=2078658 RepID=UPI002CDE4177|nr:hypothetical protein [Sporomusa sp.]HWR45497.1 hypothetical protein [Sporomusa sp.]